MPKGSKERVLRERRARNDFWAKGGRGSKGIQAIRGRIRPLDRKRKHVSKFIYIYIYVRKLGNLGYREVKFALKFGRERGSDAKNKRGRECEIKRR